MRRGLFITSKLVSKIGFLRWSVQMVTVGMFLMVAIISVYAQSRAIQPVRIEIKTPQSE